MSAEKFEQILVRQVPDAEKRRRAHFVIGTDGPLERTAKQVDDVLLALAGRPGSFYAGIVAGREPTEAAP